MNSRVLLRGFGFSGFRSFRGPLQHIGPLSEFNVIVGGNNVGKSNVLQFVQRFLGQVGRERHPDNGPIFPQVPEPDQPRGSESTPVKLALAVEVETIFENLRRDNMDEFALESARRLVGLPAFCNAGRGLFWAHFEGSPGGGVYLQVDEEQIAAAISQWGPEWTHQYQHVDNRILRRNHSPSPEYAMRDLILRLTPADLAPPVATIPTSRRIQPGAGDRLSGSGVIEQIADLENPGWMEREAKLKKFEAINSFAQAVLENTRARLDVPRNLQTILVNTGDQVMPLEHVGTGIHQVIIMAAAATTLDNTLICIEEPETNLHPVLQRRLAEYLATETSNQYLISTHSAHLLDYEQSAVFHLTAGVEGSMLTEVKQPHELNAVCGDLGYRPSDLMQANAVIWVEGPSDRLYIRRWLELYDPSIEEDIHYSIMFFGGKLVEGLTLSEQTADDLINLRRLNRHSVVVVDSDHNSAQGEPKGARKRMADEYTAKPEAPGYVWITDCYTIENYLPRFTLDGAMKAVHPGRVLTGSDEQWDNPLAKEGKKVFSKVKIAHQAIERLAREDLEGRWDLVQQISNLSAFVRSANALPELRRPGEALTCATGSKSESLPTLNPKTTHPRKM